MMSSMHYLFLFLIFLVTHLKAEMIGKVEYHLPKEASDWQMIGKVETDKKVKSTTITYAPLGLDIERFTAHVNNLPTVVEKGTLEKIIKTMFPGDNVSITVIKDKPQSILFEWSADHTYGLTKVIYPSDSTTMFIYMTQEKARFDKVRSSWIQMLHHIGNCETW